MKSTTEISVRNYHIDHFGHVNHARYVELFLKWAASQAIITNAFVDEQGWLKKINGDILAIWPDLSATAIMRPGGGRKPGRANQLIL